MRKLGVALLWALIGCGTATTGVDAVSDSGEDQTVTPTDQTQDQTGVVPDTQTGDGDVSNSDGLDASQNDTVGQDTLTSVDVVVSEDSAGPDAPPPGPDIVPADVGAPDLAVVDTSSPPDAPAMDVAASDISEPDTSPPTDAPAVPPGLPWQEPDWQATCDPDLCVTEEPCLATQCQQGICTYDYAQACDLGSCESPLEFKLGSTQNELHITLPGSKTSALPFNFFEPCLSPPGSGAQYMYRLNLVEGGWVALEMTGGSPIPNQFSMGIRTTCDGVDDDLVLCGIAQGIIANLPAGEYYVVITHWLSPGEIPSMVSWDFTLNAYFVLPDEMPLPQ